LQFTREAQRPQAWRDRFVENPDLHGIGAVRYPRLIPKDDDHAKLLEKRPLSSLGNERPTWLALAHETLDAAVFAACGWDAAMTDEEILETRLTGDEGLFSFIV
jgi:hypothetical protein